MKITDRLKTATRVLLAKNSLTNLPLSKRFWKYGSKPLVQNWSQVIMSDEDMYVGYGYATINKRANKTAQLAINSIKTEAKKSIAENAKKKDEDIEHPYLEIIDKSPTFSNYAFWYNISTYLDLEGVYYLMALRNAQGDRYGAIQEFKLLNPFEIRRVKNKDTGEVGGYAEYRADGKYREIPASMIIEIRKLNPFSSDDPFSMADAAKDSQYTLKQAGDHTRHAIQKSLNSPGIVTIGDSDIELDEEKFANFKARIQGHEKGEPIYGIGKGSIAWNDMQIDLNKSALNDVNEISLKSLIAVSGTSKTMLGLEESGVTRDTSKTQKDLFTEDQGIPQLQLIIDALNQDYKNHYPEYKTNEYTIVIDNPLGSDHDAEIKDAEVKQKQYDLYNSLINKGYDEQTAAKYVTGDIGLAELGEPKNPPVLPPNMDKKEDPKEDAKEDPKEEDTPADDKKDAEKPQDSAKQAVEHTHDHNDHDHIETVINELQDEQQGIITNQQGALQNSIANIEQRFVATIIDNITHAKNAIDSDEDLMTKKQRQSFENELELALIAFYSIIVPLYASSTLARRAKETKMLGAFNFSPQVRREIMKLSNKVASSHLETISKDILEAVRGAALDGKNIQAIIDKLTSEYSTTISKIRARTIARTETNRAFTMAQYQADKQFILTNKLGGRAYKQWVTRSARPCQYCVGLSMQAPIPFDMNFADLGDELSYTYQKKDGSTSLRKMVVDFEPLSAGTAHPNCACTYRLIIE